MNYKVLGAILMVLTGCWANVVFLEFLITYDPGSGNLITFNHFFWIAVEGFIVTTKCGTVTPNVPLRSWVTLVAMYFVVSVTNNYALNFDIPMPLHMIFRAGSLMANMMMGMLLLNKRYSPSKYLSVIMITLGIVLCTYMSAISKGTPTESVDTEESGDNFWLFVGIGLLTFALFMSARMGIYQEVIYAKFGKFPKEALFYTHALPLPGFLLLAPDIWSHFNLAMASPTFSILGLQVPSMIIYLALNVATQYICISGVFILTTECVSLTVTLIITIRKFLSLLFSIWYFSNPFTLGHWAGTALVFGGTLLFSDVPSKLKEILAPAAKDQEKKTS